MMIVFLLAFLHYFVFTLKYTERISFGNTKVELQEEIFLDFENCKKENESLMAQNYFFRGRRVNGQSEHSLKHCSVV